MGGVTERLKINIVDLSNSLLGGRNNAFHKVVGESRNLQTRTYLTAWLIPNCKLLGIAPETVLFEPAAQDAYNCTFSILDALYSTVSTCRQKAKGRRGKEYRNNLRRAQENAINDACNHVASIDPCDEGQKEGRRRGFRGMADPSPYIEDCPVCKEYRTLSWNLGAWAMGHGADGRGVLAESKCHFCGVKLNEEDYYLVNMYF